MEGSLMTKFNAVGDVVLEDPSAMRALADPARLALHAALRRRGRETVGELAASLEADPRSTGAHLQALEDVGLVERSGPGDDAAWAAVGKGIFFEIPEDAEGQSAARELGKAMLLQYADLPRQWVTDDEPQLSQAWARVAGSLNVRLLVSPDELQQIQEALEKLLERYVTREPDAAPPGASHVRLLSYFMPEARLSR
jgi:DNA-binding transcriptional ArsR family regulator